MVAGVRDPLWRPRKGAPGDRPLHAATCRSAKRASAPQGIQPTPIAAQARQRPRTPLGAPPVIDSGSVQGASFDEEEFFRTVVGSGARALLIGRRALVALGAPVLTADYDLWLHIDDIELLNGALKALELEPNRSPEQARAVGRYVLEGDERVDVMIARSKTAHDGTVLAFDDAWRRRQHLPLAPGLSLALPCVSDLVTTKRWAMRPHDIVDIEFLLQLPRTGEA